MNPISIIEEAEKRIDEVLVPLKDVSVLDNTGKDWGKHDLWVGNIDNIKSHNRQTMLKLVEEIQKNMPSHDAVQKILFDIQSYLTKEQVLSELLKK